MLTYIRYLHRAVETFQSHFFLNVHREILLRTAIKINIGCDFLLFKSLVSLGKFQEMGRKAKVSSALKKNRQNNLGNWAGCLDTDTRQDD